MNIGHALAMCLCPEVRIDSTCTLWPKPPFPDAHHFSCAFPGIASDASGSPSSPQSSSDTEIDWTENQGDTTDEDEATLADPSLRGMVALVTAACPRKYQRTLKARQTRRRVLSEDFSTSEFLQKFRRVFQAQCNAQMQKATCHDEPHKRLRRSTVASGTSTWQCWPLATSPTRR